MDIPPWLTNFQDPVSAYSQGIQIGSHIGQQQAAIQLSQENALRAQQQAEVENALNSAKFHLAQDAQQREAQREARKYDAQQRYQQMIGQGVDPAKALLSVAPDLGESLTGAAQLYKAQNPQMSPYQEWEKQFREKEYADKQKLSEAGPVAGQPILDPANHEPIPGFIAVPSATGHGYTVHLDPRVKATVGPKDAAEMMRKLPDIDYALGNKPGSKDSVTSQMSADLMDIVKAGLPKRKSKQLTKDQAIGFLNQAGGDKTKARQLAKESGYDF